MTSLLATVSDSFPIASGAEVTAEVNPDDASIERLAAFRQAGINRISLGVQSLDDAELRMLGRRHGAAEALAALASIQEAGFDNFSADLMYGLPHQGMETWQRNVEGVIGAGPQHISAYALTLEEGTPFHKQEADGLLPEQDSDLTADMYQWADEAFARAGLNNYEISNWARPGMESLHNITYWRNIPYLGVGPGAHSFLGGYRFANMKSPVGYMTRVQAWDAASGGIEGLLRETPGPRGRHRPHGRAHGDGGQRDPGAAAGRGCVRARVPRPLRRGPARRLRRGDRGDRGAGTVARHRRGC